MNDNTILRIKVPAHLYESVKEQLTLSEAKKGKHNLGAGMEIVKEKKMKTPKDGMKKVEETKDELQEQEPFMSSAVKGFTGMNPDTSAVLDTVMQLGAAGLGSAAIIAILYANRNAIKSGAKKAADVIVGKVKNAISSVKGGKEAPSAVKEGKVEKLTPDQEQAVLDIVLEATHEKVAGKKERTMEELKKAKDMLEMKMKKMEESLNEKKHKKEEEEEQ